MKPPDEQSRAETDALVKVFIVNCEAGPTVEEAVAQMQSEGYRFAQLVMPNGTYGWLIGKKA